MTNRRKLLLVLSALAGIVAFLAALQPAVNTIKAGTNATWRSLPFNQPSTADRVVDGYVAEAKTKMMWVDAPVVYEPSVDYFKRHLAQLNPFVPHVPNPSLAKASLTIPIDEVADRSPQLAGQFIAAEGKLVNHATQVAKYPSSISWAFMLADTMKSETLLVCRVPLVPIGKLDYVLGDSIVAEGVVLAAGAVRRLKPPGTERVVYMACSAVARRPVPEDGNLFNG